MELRNGESLIQYKQGLFSRIKNTIVSLFSNEEKDENKTANVGHDRLHEVLKQDRISIYRRSCKKRSKYSRR